MVQETSPVRRRSNAFDVFILNLTLISLVVMAVMLLPVSAATIGLLRFYDDFRVCHRPLSPALESPKKCALALCLKRRARAVSVITMG